MNKTVYKKILSLVLALALLVQMLPAVQLTAYAETTAAEVAQTAPEETNPADETGPEAEAEIETGTETGNETGTEGVVDTETGNETGTESGIETETGNETGTESVVDTETGNETGTESGIETETGNETGTESVVDTETGNETETEQESAVPANETGDETEPTDSAVILNNDPTPWKIIQQLGGPKSPYVFGPGIIYGEGDNEQDSMQLLKDWLAATNANCVWGENNSLQSMVLADALQLILLSWTDPHVYQSTEFKTSDATGAALPLDDQTQVLAFNGLGSRDVPFKGSFAHTSFTVRRPLFNALDLGSASFRDNKLTVEWAGGTGETGEIVATELSGASGKSLTVTLNVKDKDNITFRNAAFGQVTGDLDLTISFTGSFASKSTDDHVGLVANTVSNGALTLNITKFPSSIIVSTAGTDKNAGLLVGLLEDSSLILKEMTLPTASVQSAKGAAGGIVGEVQNSAITLNDDMNLSGVTILGKYSGGVAGKAENISFTFGTSDTDGKHFTLPAKLGETTNSIAGEGYVNSQYTGGIFGWYTYNFATVLTDRETFHAYNGEGYVYPSEPITLSLGSTSGEAGALFGHLELGSGYNFTIAPKVSGSKLEFNCTFNGTDANMAGGLVGRLKGAGKANTLTVQNADVLVQDVASCKVKYLGGIVGSVENAALRVEGIRVTVPNPSATSYFGGLTGQLRANCVLDTAGTVTVSTLKNGTATAITKGGGLVGEAGSASVVRLTGVTDLSNVAYTAGGSVGQLVAKQDNSLIFATGSGNEGNWVFRRSTTPARVDDIGNYGQVIRLGGNLSLDLIVLDGNNQVSFPKIKDAEGNEKTYGTIASADDFALHAIAFTTGNVFGLYKKKTSAEIKKTNVTLSDDIYLSGTGIQGLTRDNGSDSVAGNDNGKNGTTFDGGNHTLTIHTGEVYGLRGDARAEGEGSGQCYRHGNYGLLGTANSVIVKNLTITSTMNIGADVASNAGIVIGTVSGGNGTATIENLLQNVKVTADSAINIDGSNNKIIVNAGGFIGAVVGGETDIRVKGQSSMNATLTYTNANKDQTVSLGGLIGRATYKDRLQLWMDDVTVSGKITSTATDNARVGGLIADITPNSRGTGSAALTLKKVTVFSKVETSANTTSGGLLGYYWDNVDVTFDGSGENPCAVTTYIGDKQASLTASGAAMGGLCFAATGRWNMRGKAVDMGSAAISNGSGDLGLLVCHGERQGGTPGAYTDGENAKALYLVMEANWLTAYKNQFVIVSGTPAVFDELVAYTARSDAGNYDIMLNDAGIISLHTDGDTVGDTVHMTSGDRNTYENRTAYGKTKQTNPNSRYYYNLDTLSAPSGDIDTPEELLLWSVRQYATANIQKYLTTPTSNKITGMLDMDGYSYYPVSVVNTDVTLENAVITFHNRDIEDKETGNKSTLYTDKGETQHYAMHSGLLYDYYTNSNAKQPATLTVNNLTLLGTVGQLKSGSGALIAGKIYGVSGSNEAKIELNTLNLDKRVDESTTNHLSVSGMSAEPTPKYAPLLINRVGSFARLNVTGVTAEATGTAPGATSLIGEVGGTGAEGMTLTFSQIKLPDIEGRFTKATLLHSLCFTQTNNSATYNFTKGEDWSGTKHIKNVTYGREIGGTVEYASSGSNPGQHRYAQSPENVSYTGDHFNTEARDDFSDYLPYVATAYNSKKNYHEIQVNHVLTDIGGGCGTYGDPYRISEPEELQSIATYLATGSASNGWTLNLAVPATGESTPFCSGAENAFVHVSYQYNGSKWVNGNHELTSDTVQTYLRNAYYQITKNLTLTDFPGLGTRANPFRGVVVGKTGNETITLSGKLPKGFIVCSYGSVVKNLKLSVNGTTTISYDAIEDNSGYTSESYFGGVIGCILGGDNIIDGVGVSYTGSNVELGNTKPYLIPVGGYVGVISGGGVIFRGENARNGVPNSSVSDDNYFYANPYVGRVIQGFAVQEGGTELNNSDKNYQICQLVLSDTDKISANSNSITLRDDQALLVFSSVTNSGGAGGGNLLPYYTNAKTSWRNGSFSAGSVGGKVRNAGYSDVGSATADNGDYQASLKDDFAAFGVGNSSYLDNHYAEGALWNVCGTTSYTINLTKGTYNMTRYGNGYRSISPRYLANAVCNSATNSTVNYQYLNPLLSGFNGDGSRIQTNIVSNEYVDDDHHAIAVGGVFNTLRFTTDATMRNVTIGGESNDSKGTVSHVYYEWTNSDCADATHKNWNGAKGFTNLSYEQGRGLIAIGGFAGNNVMSTGDKTITFEGVNTQYLYIKGPFDAGGIIGHTGLRVKSDEAAKQTDPGAVNYRICYLTDGNENYVVPIFQDCSYSNLKIDGGLMVGGYMGIASYKVYAPFKPGSADETVQIQISSPLYGKLGENSSIVCQRPKTDAGIDSSKQIGSATGVVNCLPAAGGLLGCSSFELKIENDVQAIIENVEVRSSRSAGGVIGWALSAATIRKLSVLGTNESCPQIGDVFSYNPPSKTKKEGELCEFAGGLIGYFEAGGKQLRIDGCTVEHLKIVASLRGASYPCYAGGLVGDILSNTSHVIANCAAKNLILANDNYDTARTTVCYQGGLVAKLQSAKDYQKLVLSGTNLLVDSIQYATGNSSDRIGNLLGEANTAENAVTTVYLAGVSIQNSENLATILQKDIGGSKPQKCYVAYADYKGTASSESCGSAVSGAASPYVTTSPKGTDIDVKTGNGVSTLSLYGDGASPVTVGAIYKDCTTNTKPTNRFYYANATDAVFDAGHISNFHDEMGLTKDTANGIPDFPVLQVPVADANTVSNQIKSYLNLVTNGGYSTALTPTVDASTHVNSTITLYRWDEEEACFTERSDVGKGLSGRGESFETDFENYDSGKNQFELLTVTFTESGGTYEIRVPIVVRRMLEMDFTATLKDSPSFRESDYVAQGDAFNPKIAVGYGSSVSAMISYTYGYAGGEEQSYNWDVHLDRGGYMGDPGMAIQFYNPNSGLHCLPEGTQLVLLDYTNNNTAYHYKVPAHSGDFAGTSILLSDFQDADGENYAPLWLSDLMEVTATPSSTGQWVRQENAEGATARVKQQDGSYQYFRSKMDADTSNLYALNIGEEHPGEKFFLVVYIPEACLSAIPETSEEEGKNLNGYIFAEFQGMKNNQIPYHLNPVRKKQGVTETDPQRNSECTYNFLSGYIQSLEDQIPYSLDKEASDPEPYVLLDKTEVDGNYLLQMDIVDEITVVKGQKDSQDNPLYFKAEISLPQYLKKGESVELAATNGFPTTGCSGTASFYVYLQHDEAKTYYIWNQGNGKWEPAPDGEEAAFSYGWTPDGENMRLYLGARNEPDSAVSLAMVREFAKLGTEKFYVEIKMDIHMGVLAAEQAIAGATQKGDAYTKLGYTTFLASSPDRFSSTNYVKFQEGGVRYFQPHSGQSTITHSANDPTQLGINCSDLASANGVILTTGVYDLSTLSGSEKLIEDAAMVKYTLTLWQRTDKGYAMVSDPEKCLRSVSMAGKEPTLTDGVYLLTDTKTAEGSFKTIDQENAKRFLLPIRVQVNTDMEAGGLTYANYQLRLTAMLYDPKDKPLDTPICEGTNLADTRNYDYITYTITRILTGGYWGEQTE